MTRREQRQRARAPASSSSLDDSSAAKPRTRLCREERKKETTWWKMEHHKGTMRRRRRYRQQRRRNLSYKPREIEIREAPVRRLPYGDVPRTPLGDETGSGRSCGAVTPQLPQKKDHTRSAGAGIHHGKCRAR